MNAYCSVILRNGQISAASREALARSMDAFRSASPDGTLVVHFHGGLVAQADAEAIAARLGPQYAASGAFPVFFVWRTGLLETLRDNWTDVFSKEFFEGVLERVLQFLIGKANQPGGAKNTAVQTDSLKDIRKEIKKRESGEEPFGSLGTTLQGANWDLSDLQRLQFEEAIRRDANISAATDKMARDAALDQLNEELGTAISEIRDDRAKGSKGALTALALGVALKAFIASLRRLGRGRGHGLYPTAFEEVAKAILAADLLGRFAWNAMKQDTRDSFKPDNERYGGSALLQEIRQLWEKGGRPRIVLVGHSAGSIFICEMLQAAAKIGLPKDLKFEIVLLAPACTFKLLDDTLTLAPNRISKFRCFAMSDELEQKDGLIARVYPRSLLYFVSGVLENEPDEPLVGMHRFHTRENPFDDAAFPNIKRVLDSLQGNKDGWVWSLSSAGCGLNTECTTHGGFDDERTTVESLIYFIQHGSQAQ
ncbi:MAG: hypothetical protein EOS82_24580 [Mesorhizobium sp.]|uniref:hypothetical protein n=1 Tax=Mesorhizobium sp. TaxID=1871066 RepID=UPI000FE8396F|nr:hypothetical protein [Mesorhizobium sp.]RWQ45534.1 MAG: hypothetical protein EOS82_24580 [Mesorhizobium sp.]